MLFSAQNYFVLFTMVPDVSRSGFKPRWNSTAVTNRTHSKAFDESFGGRIYFCFWVFVKKRHVQENKMWVAVLEWIKTFRRVLLESITYRFTNVFLEKLFLVVVLAGDIVGAILINIMEVTFVDSMGGTLVVSTDVLAGTENINIIDGGFYNALLW